MMNGKSYTRIGLWCFFGLLIGGSAAVASVQFLGTFRMPLPHEAQSLVAAGDAVPLEDHEILVEGYVLNKRSSRPVQFVAVHPGVFSFQPNDEAIPSSLAVTDSNGFFSIIVDRDRFTHLVAVCLDPKGLGEDPAPALALSFIELPRADVSHADRTIRLDVPRRLSHCAYPIGRNPNPPFTTQ